MGTSVKLVERYRILQLMELGILMKMPYFKTEEMKSRKEKSLACGLSIY